MHGAPTRPRHTSHKLRRREAEDITISYQVSNGASVSANGAWYDALYLSPTPGFSVSDPLLGRVYQTQNLAPSGSYTGTLTATLPAADSDTGPISPDSSRGESFR